MTRQGSSRRPNMGSFGGLARRTFNHFSSGRANRVSIFNRNRQGGAGTQTRNGRTGRDTGSTTRYADSAMLYRRKAAPKKLRNRVRRFANRVRAVIDGEVGLQIAVIPYATSSAGFVNPVGIVSLQNTQAHALIPGLYSMNGNHSSTTINENWYDIYSIFNAAFSSAELLNDCILEFTSACWNCTMTNVTQGTEATQIPAIVDIYECVARRDWKPSDDPGSLFTNTLPTTINFPGSSANALSFGQLGVTPFDNPNFCESWKILKMRRIKLEPNATATLQFRDPKRRKIEYQSKVQNKSWVKGVSRCWIPIVYGVPWVVSSVGYMAGPAQVNINVTRNYHFRKLENSSPSAAIVNA